MTPETPSVVRATQAWLQSSRRVQVPFAWLEACVEWIQGEAGGAAHLSQQQINQQVGTECVQPSQSHSRLSNHTVKSIFTAVSDLFFSTVSTGHTNVLLYKISFRVYTAHRMGGRKAWFWF